MSMVLHTTFHDFLNHCTDYLGIAYITARTFDTGILNIWLALSFACSVALRYFTLLYHKFGTVRPFNL